MQQANYRRGQQTINLVRSISPDCRPLAGGTDMIARIRSGIDAPHELVDLKTSDLSDEITDNNDELSMGALVTLADIERSEAVAARAPMLVTAASSAATPQIRHRATIAGNLLQRPRCWYYRDPDISCWLKGGNQCPAADGRNEHHAIFDTSVCRAVHPSDLAPALIAHDAMVSICGPGGERQVSVSDLFQAPTSANRQETNLDANELVTGIQLAPLPENAESIYLKAMDRKAWAFALFSVAVVLAFDCEQIVSASVVLGGVASIPWRLPLLEQALVGMSETDHNFVPAIESAFQESSPMSENAYKLPMGKALVNEALTDLLERRKQVRADSHSS